MGKKVTFVAGGISVGAQNKVFVAEPLKASEGALQAESTLARVYVRKKLTLLPESRPARCRRPCIRNGLFLRFSTIFLWEMPLDASNSLKYLQSY